jgi:hypothetical protein
VPTSVCSSLTVNPWSSTVLFTNSPQGYQSAKQLLLEALEAYPFNGLDVSGEATSYFWFPFFLQLAADPDLEPHDLNLYLLNPRWDRWFPAQSVQDRQEVLFRGRQV